MFSRVGIAREVLTDQGSCFMSRVMKELLSLLLVKQELRKAGLTANPAKCPLGLEETSYLGYQV